jgi:hypothetical protein
MALDVVLFVSKRLQLAAAGLLCLVAAQCTMELAQAPAPAAASIAVIG